MVALNLKTVQHRNGSPLPARPHDHVTSDSGGIGKVTGGGASAGGAAGGRRGGITGDLEGRLKVHTWFLCSLTASHLSSAARAAVAEGPLDVLQNLMQMLDCPGPQCGRCNRNSFDERLHSSAVATSFGCGPHILALPFVRQPSKPCFEELNHSYFCFSPGCHSGCYGPG